ncbi:MAG: TonB-dependent receptor [Melioribacteraceae bacterium]
MNFFTARNRVTYFFVFFVLLLFSNIEAQTGKIAGRVLDKNTGEPLPFVNIIVLETSIGAASDIEGYYSILNVRPGTYSIKASAIGYQAVTFSDVRVSIDLTTKIDIQLAETSVSLGQDIVVVASKPLVTRDLTASTSLIGSDEIASLPVTEFSEILELQAGVVGGNVRGGRRGEVVYAIDGVPVTDVYDGSTVVDVNASSIQELQFISGAFNAEYGRALSAFVNLATKEGDNRFTGSVTTYFGDYFTQNDNVFRGGNDFNPTAIRNFEGSLSGPIIPNTLYFYTNARYVYFDGWMKGQRLYNPWDITVNKGPSEPVETRYTIQETGDKEIVPMNWNEKVYAQGKLTYKPIPQIKLNYNYIIDKVNYRDYNHDFVLNPDGDYHRFRSGATSILSMTHTIGTNTFYQLSGSYFYKMYRHFVYEDYNDPRYTHYLLLDQQPKESPSFKTGGTQSQHFKRTTNSYGLKLDLTSQVTRIHQMKFGFELNQNAVSYDDTSLLQYIDANGNGVYDPGEDGIADPQVSLNPYVNMRIPDINNPDENLSINRYERKPIEFSAYLQDKLELDEMIVNIGVRFDFFAPDGRVLTDRTDPDIYRPRNPANIAKTYEERLTYWYKDATAKMQFSPRLGVAFPITDKGVIHFSYGHFFQTPNYEFLYSNPDYKFGFGTDNLGIAGNPDLKPEQTVSGEIGVQQALTDELTVDLTGYFRDIRNLTGTRADEIILYGGAGKYSQYVNSDFGFVRGIVVSVSKRFMNNWSATLDYTLQTAKGNASDPAATRNQLANGEQPEIQLVSLNWDQTHTLNATFSYSAPEGWGLSMIAQYGSGFPYTPTQSLNISKLLTNSELKPSSFNVDLRAFYDLNLAEKIRLSFFARIYNLFDIKNQTNVYQDSGTADFTLDEFLRKQSGSPQIVNTLDEYYRRADFYSEPRRVEFGFSLYFN